MNMLTGMSTLRFSRLMAIGSMTAVSPAMSRVFIMLEPTTLPMEMSALPLTAPMKLTTISGAEVPIPTMVNPITNSLIPIFLARLDEPSTSISAPPTMRKSPAMSMRI